jgi:hypothetical protein
MERKRDKGVIDKEAIRAKLALARKKKEGNKKERRQNLNAKYYAKKTSSTKAAPAKKSVVTKHRPGTESTSFREGAKRSAKTRGPEKSAPACQTE